MTLAKRQLGSTGLQLSILGLGTVKFGRNQGVKYPQAFQLPSDQQAANLLALAADQGINLLDTAPAYGTSEIRLGSLLKHQRQRWQICTKVGEEFVNGASFFDFSAKHTRYSIERSLQRLNTDYLDIVLVHSNGDDLDIINNSDALSTLAQLKEEGKIRAFGMSTKTVAGGLLAAQHSDCVMVTWNLAHQEEKAVIDYCQDHNKGVLIKKALASGHSLSQTDDDPIARSFDMMFNHEGVTSAIIGTIHSEHLISNVGKASRW